MKRRKKMHEKKENNNNAQKNATTNRTTDAQKYPLQLEASNEEDWNVFELHARHHCLWRGEKSVVNVFDEQPLNDSFFKCKYCGAEMRKHVRGGVQESGFVKWGAEFLLHVEQCVSKKYKEERNRTMNSNNRVEILYKEFKELKGCNTEFVPRKMMKRNDREEAEEFNDTTRAEVARIIQFVDELNGEEDQEDAGAK